MDAWNKLRQVNNSNFDVCLRKTQELINPCTSKKDTSKYKRKKKIPEKKSPIETPTKTPVNDESSVTVPQPKSAMKDPTRHVHFEDEVVAKSEESRTELEIEASYEPNENELERRNANIACLLDTPFKSDLEFTVPPTPGAALINNTTMFSPQTKLINQVLQSAENNPTIKIGTKPVTPHILLDTPHSGLVDYSSGSSYYRPDESEDIDKELDKKFKEEMSRRNKVTPHKSEDVQLEEHQKKEIQVETILIKDSESEMESNHATETFVEQRTEVVIYRVCITISTTSTTYSTPTA